MASEIATGEGSLKAGADAVDTAKQNIDDRIRAIQNDIGELRGYWQGAAASAFGNLGDQWNEKARKLNAILVDLSDSLRGTEKDQIAAEDEYKSTISGLGSIMGG